MDESDPGVDSGPRSADDEPSATESEEAPVVRPGRLELWGLWLVVRVVAFLVTPLQVGRWLWLGLPCSLAEYMAFEWDSARLDVSEALAGSTYSPIKTAMLIPWVFGTEFRSEQWREIQRHLRQGH